MIETEPAKGPVLLPSLIVTSVGSLPHTDPEKAVDLIMETLHMAPHVPQLPRLDPREQMWIQYAENLPRFRFDLDNLHYYFDTSGDNSSEIENFYSHYLEVEEGGNADFFAVGIEHGRGIKAFSDRVSTRTKKLPFIKGQVTGPLSFSLTVSDETGKPIFYHPVFRDIAVKGMGLKAVWLLERLKPFAEKVIIFFDEPGLSAYGSSAFLGVSKADVVDSLNDVMNMVASRGGITGIHCCGNTDWGMLFETSVHIINFDAVDYLESVAIYSRELSHFLARGGVLAWGAVRNTERVRQESTEEVIGRLYRGVDFLAGSGVPKTLLKEKIILTPACGCAGLTESDAQKVYETLSGLELKTI